MPAFKGDCTTFFFTARQRKLDVFWWGEDGVRETQGPHNGPVENLV